MLHRALEHDGSGKGKDIRCFALTATLVVGIIELVESGTTEIHRTHGVADEGMDAGIASLSITHTLREMQVLTGKYCLGGCIGREHALPTARKGASMEDDEQTEVVGVGEDILIELHHRLLVATKEIHLDTTNTDALHPCHLSTTGL